MSIPSYNKFGARKTVVDNITFHSAKEALRYQELKILQMAGQIRDLDWQVPYPLRVGDVVIGKYIADFKYVECGYRDGLVVIEDCKGFRTPMYRWKKKHFEAQYSPWKIKET